jgi:probable F420-dependent oxidoreductase
MVKIAQEAESLGYDSVWANDHMTTQKYVKELSDEPPNYYEPLVTHAVLAEATEKIKLGTSVVVLPMRNPVILAKQVATLDVLSGGRLILGLGSGAYPEEFQALNPHLPTKARSKIMDESVAALNRLLTQHNASFEGEYVKFKDVEMYPKPLQKPLPTWICGNSINGIRRTAESGTGWSPANLLPEEVRDGITKLANLSKTAGRPNTKYEIAPQYIVVIDETKAAALTKFEASPVYKHFVSLQASTLKRQTVESFIERSLVGTVSEVVEKLNKLQTAGVTYMAAMVFPAQDLDEFVAAIRLFAKEIMPSF